MYSLAPASLPFRGHFIDHRGCARSGYRRRSSASFFSSQRDSADDAARRVIEEARDGGLQEAAQQLLNDLARRPSHDADARER